jgi:hypothetical protein
MSPISAAIVKPVIQPSAGALELVLDLGDPQLEVVDQLNARVDAAAPRPWNIEICQGRAVGAVLISLSRSSTSRTGCYRGSLRWRNSIMGCQAAR